MKRIFHPFRAVSEAIGDGILKAHIAVENRKSEAHEIIAALPENERREIEASSRKYALVGMMTGLFVLTAGEAFAAQNFGAILDGFNKQLSNGAGLFGTASYVLGGATAISGLSSLKKHSENPNDPAHTIKSGGTKVAVGAGLVGLGSTLGSGLNTIFGTTNSIGVTNGTSTSAIQIN